MSCLEASPGCTPTIPAKALKTVTTGMTTLAVLAKCLLAWCWGV